MVAREPADPPEEGDDRLEDDEPLEIGSLPGGGRG